MKTKLTEPPNPPKVQRRRPKASGSMLRYRCLWQMLGWGMLAVVIWLSLTPSPPRPPFFLTSDKAQHAVAYAGLMVWYRQAFQRHWRWPAFLLALGVLLETLQGLGGVRTSDPYDALANAVGVLVGLGLAETWFGRILAIIESWVAEGERNRMPTEKN